MAVTVRNLAMERRELEPFFGLAGSVYRGDPHYCAPFFESVMANLTRESFAGRQKAMVAAVDGEVVARVVARVSPELQGDDGRSVGMLGFFEAQDRSDAVAALFESALSWLKDRGAGLIVGPMDGDTWHSYRLNVGPREERPFLMEPYNPTYYRELWESNGFEVLERYYSSCVDDLPQVLRHLGPKARRPLEAGYRLEKLELAAFDDELSRLYELSCDIFSGNFLYSEISREQFVSLYAGARALIDPDLVWFAVAPDGSDAGFLFALPDRARAVAAMRGSRGLAAKLRFLALRSRTDTVNLKSLGVAAAHRRSGLAAALMYRGYDMARNKRYDRANLCLILDDNPSGKLDAGLGRPLRRYHLYRWSGGAVA